MKPLIVKRNLAKDDEIRGNYSILILFIKEIDKPAGNRGKNVSALWRKIKSELDKKLV